jgi:hypothetical protein
MAGAGNTNQSKPRTLFMRDIVDGQLRTREGRRIGRVADVEVEWTQRGLFMRSMTLGPEAHAGRVSGRLSDALHRLFDGRHEHYISVDEIEEIGPNVMLKETADAYDVGNADSWIRDHLFRFIPGSEK